MFHCTCRGQGGYLIRTLTNSSEQIAIVPIGRCYASGTEYSAFVALAPLPGGSIEHVFAVMEASDTGETNYYDGLSTRALISDASDRAAVLDAFCHATNHLVSEYLPERISHCTYAAGLPEKALRKHHRLMMVIEQCGYRVQKPDPFNGQHLWFADRLR